LINDVRGVLTLTALQAGFRWYWIEAILRRGTTSGSFLLDADDDRLHLAERAGSKYRSWRDGIARLVPAPGLIGHPLNQNHGAIGVAIRSPFVDAWTPGTILTT
jgi:hypothetical protein